jgi:hypothetical protein
LKKAEEKCGRRVMEILILLLVAAFVALLHSAFAERSRRPASVHRAGGLAAGDGAIADADVWLAGTDAGGDPHAHHPSHDPSGDVHHGHAHGHEAGIAHDASIGHDAGIGHHAGFGHDAGGFGHDCGGFDGGGGHH